MKREELLRSLENYEAVEKACRAYKEDLENDKQDLDKLLKDPDTPANCMKYLLDLSNTITKEIDRNDSTIEWSVRMRRETERQLYEKTDN